MHEIYLPETLSHYSQLVRDAFSHWVPEGKVLAGHPLGGLSGATVLKVDISGISPEDGATLLPLAPGQYILKLYDSPEWNEPDGNEESRHERAFERLGQFAQEHVPKLVATYPLLGRTSEHTNRRALLYSIAGRSTRTFVSVSDLGATAEDTYRRLMVDLLEHGCDETPSEPVSGTQLLQEWLGYRLDEDKAPALHQLVHQHFGDSPEGLFCHEVLPNPLAMCKSAEVVARDKEVVLRGLIHGDLHPGNILVHSIDPYSHPYWVIDFALSREAPVGYDQAYLETAVILSTLGERDPNQCSSLLAALSSDGGVDKLAYDLSGLKVVLRSLREDVSAWFRKNHGGRMDAVQRQLSLARVAAALNWANKPISPNQKEHALLCAAWAAKKYLLETSGATQLAPVLSTQTDSERSAANDIELLWDEAWEQVEKFDPRTHKYVLVTEPIGTIPFAESLGLIPWSLVIDLDPWSDEEGLYSRASGLLRAQRNAHLFALDLNPADFHRGTSWMLASGWARRSVLQPDYNRWRWDWLPKVRELCIQMREAIAPDIVHVVALFGPTTDATVSERRARLLLELEEAFRGEARILILGSSLNPMPLSATYVPLPVSDFTLRIAAVFGTRVQCEQVVVPGPVDKEAAPIPLQALRQIEENLEILHSRLPQDAILEYEADASSFWRGATPSWTDLNANRDVIREIHEPLIDVLRSELDKNRNFTVELLHTPGSGGTTVALRAAWDLHREYPTALIRRHTSSLVEHVDQLFNLAGRPILLVAEEAILRESFREQFYRQLSERNCRVVLLYVRRTLSGDSKARFQLENAMSEREALAFRNTFSALTNDPVRQKEMDRIATVPAYKRYRVPFFYGLVAFEREFESIERFVKNHLFETGARIRDVLCHLALLSRYSQQGLHFNALKRLLGLAPGGRLNLVDLVGDGAARLLVIQRSHVRVMHPIIAEQMLASFSNGKGANAWKGDLAYLSGRFIDDLDSYLDVQSDDTGDMLDQLFVSRPAGNLEFSEENSDSPGGCAYFSELIEEISSRDKNAGLEVMDKLTKVCPNESHFWNHKGRYQIYKMNHAFASAESCLKTAIELSPSDDVHFHTLGLVYKFWISDRIRDVRKAGAQAVFVDVQPLFESACAAFGESRRLDASNIHAYITQVQVTLDVALNLQRIAKVGNLAELAEVSEDISDWVSSYIPAAERLLDQSRQLYGTARASVDHYLTSCNADLQQLYGNADEVIRLWELALERQEPTPSMRRRLVRAYLHRRKRRWSEFSEPEVRRLCILLEQNISQGGANESDFENWFEVYRYLEDFQPSVALHRLRLASEHYESLTCFFYVYVLEFLGWLVNRDADKTEVEVALAECQRRRVGRRGLSHFWLAKEPVRCPVIAEYELGEWSSERRFWADPTPLRRLNGYIERIVGPQAGTIIIDGGIRAFFVPGPEFRGPDDLNAEVSFYVGFSYEGARAWKVERGWVEGNSRRDWRKKNITLEDVQGGTATPSKEGRKGESGSEKAPAIQRELILARVGEFARELALARQNGGSILRPYEVQERAAAAFGNLGSVAKALGLADWDAILKVLPEIEVILTAEGSAVRPKPLSHAESQRSNPAPKTSRIKKGIVASYGSRGYGFISIDSGGKIFFHVREVLNIERGEPKIGQHVEFVMSKNARGPVATQVHLLP